MSEENGKNKKNEVNTIQNNSDILFIYEAKMCNPNGDPDDENKPRMDYNSNRNLVSDVRLKRYVRDYLMDYKDKTIFVSKSEGNVVNAKTSLAGILDIKNKSKISLSEEQVESFLNKAIDVRMFGAIVPDATFEEGKGNVTFTGPIQFNWGHSLNKVTGPTESSGITSHFQTGKITEDGESTKGAGAMGKDYRVAYSIIAFHGIISATRAKHTRLTDKDISLFDDAMIHAIPLEATTRSKIGQIPLLYLRVEYNTKEFFFGDFRRYVKLIDKEGHDLDFNETAKLRHRGEYKIDLSMLKKKLLDVKDKIEKICVWSYEEDIITGWFEKDIKESENKDEKIPFQCITIKEET